MERRVATREEEARLEELVRMEREAEMLKALLDERLIAWKSKFVESLTEAAQMGILRVAEHMLQHAIRADIERAQAMENQERREGQ